MADTAHDRAAEPAPTAGPAGSDSPAPGTEAGASADETTLYTYQPELLPQDALLGTLIHAPAAIFELEKWLGPRDFESSELRAVYNTVRGLALARPPELQDVSAAEGPGAKMEAAKENFEKVFDALDRQLYSNVAIPNPKRVLARLNEAAPQDALPYRGTFDPGAQLRLGRMVLEHSIRRQVENLGVRVIRPSAAARRPFGRRSLVDDMRTNLGTAQAQLDRLSHRLALAVERTGPSGDKVTTKAAEVAAQAPAPRRWVPSPLRALTSPLVQRAERHLIHLALHSGTSGQPDLKPEDFSSDRLANTWVAIQRIRDRGDSVNYVSLLEELRPDVAEEQLPPTLSSKQIFAMREGPDNSEAHVARSLRTVVDASLKRVSVQGRNALRAIARSPGIDPNDLLDQSRKEVTSLAERAKIAGTQHQQAREIRGGRGAGR